MNSKPHSDPDVIREALGQAWEGMYGHVSENGREELEAATAALTRLVEQYENVQKLALKGQTREAEIMRLEEQLEALRDEAQKMAGSVIWLDNNLHNYGSEGWREFFKAALRDARRLYALTESGGDVGHRPSPSGESSPASDPFSGEPGTPSSAGGSWGNSGGGSFQDKKP